AVGRHERAPLEHVGTEHLAQRRVEQVRRRVVALRVVARRLLDRGPYSERLTAAGELAIDVAQDRDSPGDAAHLVDHEAPAVAFDRAAVADLPAGLGVEGVLPELEREPAVQPAIRQDISFERRTQVADELLFRLRLQLLPPGAQLVGRDLDARGATVRARPLALLLERALEPLDVHRVPALA